MKNYVDHSRVINSIVVILFSICVFLPLISYAETQSEIYHNEILTKISINEANKKQLISLKGIGVKKAQAIISYREENGVFSSLDELINVKGVGSKILNDNLLILSI